MRISRAQREELVAHAREEAPNECCGYMSLKDGVVEDVFRAVNERKSPYGYEFGFEALQAANDLDEAGYEVAVYHSHPRSPAEPSQTDINLANGYPHWRHVIVSPEGEPQLRAWRIVDRRVDEDELVVDD